MMLEVLSPGMQHAEEADLGAEVLGIGGDLEQSGGAGAKQQMIDGLLILQRQPRQFMRQREDHVEVADGK
jgi:hypothetical protein